MNLQHDAHKQTETIISDSLLPQEYKMEYCMHVKNA